MTHDAEIDLTEERIDAMMAAGQPVQITGPPTATVVIPGAFAHYLDGTGDLSDAPGEDAVALRKAWANAPTRRFGRNEAVVLTAGYGPLWLLLGHAEFVAAQSRADGEWSRAEIRGADTCLARLKKAMATLPVS